MDYSHDAHFEHCKTYIKRITQTVLQNGLPQGVVLNVNFPKVSNTPLQGIKICRQARARWEEDFDKRKNPMGRDYYWLSGEFVNQDTGEDTDEWALENNYVSVVPVQFDLTAHQHIKELAQLNF